MGQRFLVTGTCCLCQRRWSPEADNIYLVMHYNGIPKAAGMHKEKSQEKPREVLCIFAAVDKITFEYIMCLFPGVPCGCSRRIETP